MRYITKLKGQRSKVKVTPSRKFYSHDDPTMAELADEPVETLFTAVLNNDDHVLRYVLPERRNNTCCLRPKLHELTLATKRDSRNFYQRLLFKDKY